MRNKVKVAATLLLDGETVLTTELEKGCDPVEIGRSRSCGICTPADDHSVSSRHARLFWKGSSLFIEDAGSRNGVFFRGERIKKAVKADFLLPYSIGRCQIRFSPVGGGEKKSGGLWWQVEFLNGERVHEVVPVKPADGRGEFTIGTDAENDLVLKDMAISRRHARIVVRPDSAPSGSTCWICDNASRNGTTVNGEKLVSDRERLLKDGDKFSLAYLNFQIHNPDWKPTPSPWNKVVVAVITLLLLVAGYQIYTTVFVPQASEYIALAESAAADEAFEAGLVYAQKAVEVASGTDKILAENCLNAVKEQEATRNGWRQAVAYLQKGDLYRARSMIVTLVGDGSTANWGWNKGVKESAKLAHDEAIFVSRFFDALGSPDDELEQAGRGVGSKAFVADRVAAIDAYLSGQSARLSQLKYMDAAVKRLKRHRAEMQTILDGILSVDKALAAVRIDSANREVSDFATVVGGLERVAGSASLPVGVRNYAKDLLPVCRRFCDAQEFLKREKARICDMDFEGVRGMENSLPVPGNDDCALHRTLSDVREALIGMHANYQHVVSILAPMVRNLDSIGIRNNEKGHVLAFVMDEATWRKALSFDCFEARFPLPSRIDPTSVYDELIGIEYTYENLRELPKPLGRKNAVLMNFVPKCQSARAAFDQVKMFQKMMERPESVAFRVGKLGALYALAAQILADRDGIAAVLKKMSGTKHGEDRDRGKIVAGYYSEYFSDEPSYADLRALEMSFKKLQKKVAALNEKYDSESDPEKRLKIKREIIAVGIPGMEAVRRVWVNAE